MIAVTDVPDAVLERYLQKIAFLPTGGQCWLWLGGKNAAGYGTAYLGVPGARYFVPAHHVLKELMDGPCPPGCERDHLCRNTSCVRPSHIEYVTKRENVQRAYAARTHCRNGHPITEASTRITRSGYRRCRVCHADSQRRHRRRKS